MGDDDVFDDSAEGEILIRERDLHRMSQDLYKVPSKSKNAESILASFPPFSDEMCERNSHFIFSEWVSGGFDGG